MASNSSAAVLDPIFEHAAWGTQVLLDRCVALSASELAVVVPGAFGTIFETLHHYIESDGHYAARVAPHLWPADFARDANDAWEASLGGPQAFEWVRSGGPESLRLERRRTAFLSGDLAGAFDLLRARAIRVAGIWRAYAADAPDVSARCRWPAASGGSSESSAAVQILQAIRHAHEHQEQVCAALTSLGIEAPNLSGLAWGQATGDVQAVELSP